MTATGSLSLVYYLCIDIEKLGGGHATASQETKVKASTAVQVERHVSVRHMFSCVWRDGLEYSVNVLVWVFWILAPAACCEGLMDTESMFQGFQWFILLPAIVGKGRRRFAFF